MNSATQHRDNLRGALYMSAAMFGFASNDLVMKSFSGELNLGQIILLRGLFATALIFILAGYNGQLRPLAVALRPAIMVRGLGELVATWAFLTALFHIPLATVSAVMQALPLAVTIGAMLFFNEKVGWRRLSAIIIGLAGVLIIVRPGMNGFSPYALLALVAVLGCVVRDLVTRNLPADIPSLFISLVTSVLVTLLGAMLALFEKWKPVSNVHLALLGLSSAFLIIGYFFAVNSMRFGEIGFVSPFRYLVLLFSIIGAAIAYREYPDALTLVGAAIVVATGIYTLYREQQLRRQDPAADQV